MNFELGTSRFSIKLSTKYLTVKRQSSLSSIKKSRILKRGHLSVGKLKKSKNQNSNNARGRALGMLGDLPCILLQIYAILPILYGKY